MRKTLLLSLGMLGLILPVSAQTLFTQTFDTDSTPNGGTAAGYQSASATVTRLYTDGAGVGGSRALMMNMTFTEWGNDAAYQYQNGVVSGNTSSSLSDYTLSFDLAGSVASAAVNLQFQGWPGQWYSGTMTATYDYQVTLSATANSWQSYSINLGAIGGGFNPASSTWQIAFNPKSWNWGGPGAKTLAVDNISLSMVPEPSSLALAGLGAAALFLRRRRS